MATDADAAAGASTFELACNDCTFETTVQGSVDDVLDVADAHREAYSDMTARHFVDFERSDV